MPQAQTSAFRGVIEIRKRSKHNTKQIRIENAPWARKQVSGTRAHSHSHRHEASESERERERERERKRKKKEKERERERAREREKERNRERERERETGANPPQRGIPKIQKQTLRKNIFREWFCKITKTNFTKINSRRIIYGKLRIRHVIPENILKIIPRELLS